MCWYLIQRRDSLTSCGWRPLLIKLIITYSTAQCACVLDSTNNNQQLKLFWGFLQRIPFSQTNLNNDIFAHGWARVIFNASSGLSCGLIISFHFFKIAGTLNMNFLWKICRILPCAMCIIEQPPRRKFEIKSWFIFFSPKNCHNGFWSAQGKTNFWGGQVQTLQILG